MGSVEADDERQIAVADDWQLHRLAHTGSTDTAAPCPRDIGGPSEQAYTRPAPGRPASAAQYAVDVQSISYHGRPARWSSPFWQSAYRFHIT